MTKEITFDYTWVLQQLHALYLTLNLPNSTVIVTDIKRGLMAAIENIFSTFNHLLCLWHINNNVLVNCKKHFDFKEAQDTFED